jgi:hypothetical protein
VSHSRYNSQVLLHAWISVTCTVINKSIINSITLRKRYLKKHSYIWPSWEWKIEWHPLINECFTHTLNYKFMPSEEVRHYFLLVTFNIWTNSMELSPSPEDGSCAATQEFPNILWNRKVCYFVHMSPPLGPVLRQINPVHTTPSYLSMLSGSLVTMARCVLRLWIEEMASRYEE